MPEYLCIDRLEDKIAICQADDRSFHQIPRENLPAEAKEGDCLQKLESGYMVDSAETARRRKANHDQFQQLLKRTQEAKPVTDRIIRRLELSDIDLVMGMEGRFRENFLDRESSLQFLGTPSNWFCGCVEQDKIIGFAYGYELQRLNSAGPMLYIHEVGVLPQYQRQGIGSAIIKHLQVCCKKQGFCKLFLFTEKSNTAACHLYESTGGVPAHLDDQCYFFPL